MCYVDTFSHPLGIWPNETSKRFTLLEFRKKKFGIFKKYFHKHNIAHKYCKKFDNFSKIRFSEIKLLNEEKRRV